MVQYGHGIEIYEYDHFHLEYEDYKNNLFITVLEDDIAEWLLEFLDNRYDINVDDLWNDPKCGFMIIEFECEEDAMAFKLGFL